MGKPSNRPPEQGHRRKGLKWRSRSPWSELGSRWTSWDTPRNTLRKSQQSSLPLQETKMTRLGAPATKDEIKWAMQRTSPTCRTTWAAAGMCTGDAVLAAGVRGFGVRTASSPWRPPSEPAQPCPRAKRLLRSCSGTRTVTANRRHHTEFSVGTSYTFGSSGPRWSATRTISWLPASLSPVTCCRRKKELSTKTPTQRSYDLLRKGPESRG